MSHKKGFMQKVQHWLETDTGKGVSNTATCIGAAIVLLGALFKIMHWPGASIMLVAGMLTEVCLFLMFAVIPPHKSYHWEKVYAGLAVLPDDDPGSELHKIGENLMNGAGGGLSKNGELSEKFDEMMEKSNIDEDALVAFGDNFKTLGGNISKLSNLTNVAEVTEEFSNKTKSVSEQLEKMLSAYSNTAEVIGGVSDTLRSLSESANVLGDVEDVKEAKSEYVNATKTVTTELGKLQSVYSEVSSSLSDTIKSIKGLDNTMDSTKQYGEEMSQLTYNLSAMNKVYTNLLTAMNHAPQGQSQSNNNGYSDESDIRKAA